MFPEIYNQASSDFDPDRNKPCFLKFETCDAPVIDLSQASISLLNCLQIDILCVNQKGINQTVLQLTTQ